eukprot:3288707-Pyramimonas_sp.AAC.1
MIDISIGGYVSICVIGTLGTLRREAKAFVTKFRERFPHEPPGIITFFKWIMLDLPTYRVTPIFSMQVLRRVGEILDMRICGLRNEDEGDGGSMGLEEQENGDSKAMERALY